MIVTLTPNPSVDRTVEVDRLERGAVLRARDRHVDAGGKGINVALAAAAHGHATRAVFPAGGAEGTQLRDLVAQQGLDSVIVPITEPIRANISVVEPDGTVTKFNEPGPTLSSEEIDALLAVTIDTARDATWIVGCGSLPPGTPVDLFARLVELGHRAGKRVAIDTSGEPLVAALAAGPDAVKPNQEELVEAAGLAVRSVADAVSAAHRLRELGAQRVLASLGPNGIVYVDSLTTLHAVASVVHPRSSVGAGDAALAGFLTAGGHPWRGVTAAAAFGSAAVRLPGSVMPGPRDIDLSAVVVTAVDGGAAAVTTGESTGDGARRRPSAPTGS